MIRFKIQIVASAVGDFIYAYRSITRTLIASSATTGDANSSTTPVQTRLHFLSDLKDFLRFIFYYKYVFGMVWVKFLKNKIFSGS